MKTNGFLAVVSWDGSNWALRSTGRRQLSEQQQLVLGAILREKIRCKKADCRVHIINVKNGAVVFDDAKDLPSGFSTILITRAIRMYGNTGSTVVGNNEKGVIAVC